MDSHKVDGPKIEDVVKKMSGLACLKSGPGELARFSQKVEAVLNYVRQLGELDASGIEPTSHAFEISASEMALSLRQDEPVRSGVESEIVGQAPASDGPFIQVPKVIDEE